MSPRFNTEDPAAVLAALEIEAPSPEWLAQWPASAASFCAGDTFFTKSSFISATCAELRIEADIRDALLAVAATVRKNPAAERLAWHCHWLLFADEAKCGNDLWLPAVEGKAGGLFPALVLLSGYPHVRSIHSRHHIDGEITVDTLSEFERCIGRDASGQWGMSATSWLRHHFAGTVFRIGRLVYQFHPFSHPFRVYRSRLDNRIVMLAESGCQFRSDGQFASADDGEGSGPLWSSRLRRTPDGACGHPVDAKRGSVLRDEVVLPAAGWREVLAPGDKALAVHIPSGGPLDHAECGESFASAVLFFREKFPTYKSRAFTCLSWLVCPELERVLPASANIVRFLREWCLHPCAGASVQPTLRRVFGSDNIDPATAPRDSSLRRAIAGHLQAGGTFRDGGAVLFAQDLDWGRCVYRKQEQARFDATAPEREMYER